MYGETDKLRTDLAQYAHDQAWSGWMRYMFGKCFNMDVLSALPSGHLIVPPELVQRWARQMNTPFDELPESERKSDYDEADKMIKIFERHFEDLCPDCDGEGDMP